MLGVLPTPEAMQLATQAGLDLVEVSADSSPPVCRIMDHGKALYERRKKRASSASQRTLLKQIRLRAKTDRHDIDFKLQQARSFLRRKHKVKVNILFRGRENAHHDRGRELLKGFIEELKDVGNAEAPPRMESKRSISVLISPRTSQQEPPS